MEGAWQGREAIAPRPRKSGDFLFASSREAKSSPQAEQAVRHEAETRLQQRLKGHLKEFRREAASTEIKARPPKSDEEICRDLSSTEALEMRSFRGSDLWLSYITTSLDGTQSLAPRWKEHTVDADVPLASGSLDIFLGAASLDPMDLMQQDGCASRSQSQDRRSDRGEAEMAAISPSAEEKPRASATKVDAFLLEEVPAASKSSKESLFKTEVDVLVPANMQEQVAPALEMEDIFNKHAGGDGALSQQELEMLQGENAHLRQLDFDKLDLDGDGVVSKEELATALDWDTMEEVKGEDLLRRYDGGDGTLSREELEQMKGENAHLRQLDFDKLDLDGDGVVSKEELATALDWDSMGEVKEEVSARGKRASDASNAKAKAAKVASALDVHKKSREAFDLRSAASQRKEKRRAKRKSIQDLAETSDIVQNGDVAQESGHSKDEGLQRKTATEQAISTTIANNLADPEIRRRAATSVEDQEQRIVGDVEHALEVEGHGGVPSEESEVGQETLAQQKQNQEVSQEKVAHPGQEKRQKRVGQEHEARREKREHQEQQEQQKQDITGEHVAEQGPEKQETKEQEPRQEHVTQQASAKQELQEPELCRECVAQQGLEKQEPQEHEPRQEQGPEEQEQGGCEDLGAHGMQSKEEKRVSQEHEASQEKEQLEQEASHEDVAQQEHDKQHQEHITRGREAHAEEVGQKHKAQEMQEKHQGQEQDENAPESVAIRRSAGSAGLVVARQIVKQSGEQPTPEEGLLANLPDQREDEMPKEHVFAGQAEAAAPSVRTSMKSNESLVQGCHPPADQVSEDRRRLQDLREAGVLESASESEGTITPKEDAREPALQQEDQGRDSYVSSAGLDFETF